MLQDERSQFTTTIGVVGLRLTPAASLCGRPSFSASMVSFDYVNTSLYSKLPSAMCDVILGRK